MSTQIIFGFDLNKFKTKFPTENFEKFWEIATRNNIHFYGIDSFLGGKMTGQGLDFTETDRLVPRYIELAPEGATLIFPVSSYNIDRLQETYQYFLEKGWLSDRQWAIFNTKTSDEVRYRKIIKEHNIFHSEILMAYPKLKTIVTDTRIPVIPSHTDEIVLGDIIIAQAHHKIFEEASLNMCSFSWAKTLLDAAYIGSEYGIYIAGSFEDTDDVSTKLPFKPAYYEQVMSELYNDDNPPIVPTPDTMAGDIIPYCNFKGYKYWLHWNGNEWIKAGPNGEPLIRTELIQLINGR